MKLKSLCLGLVLVLLSNSLVFGTPTLTDSVENNMSNPNKTEQVSNDSNSESAVGELELESEEVLEEVVLLSYKDVVDGIISTLNSRDSYYFEILNPVDSISYIKDLGISVPDDVNKSITRLEFVVLLNSLPSKMTNQSNYSTDLIEMTDIFTDISELSDSEISAIESIFVEGLMGGKHSDKFCPNDVLTENELNIVLSRLSNGYNRNKLFSVVESCFTEDARIAVLEKYGYIKNSSESTDDSTTETTGETDEVTDNSESIIITDEIEHTVDEISSSLVEDDLSIDVYLSQEALSSLMVTLGEEKGYTVTDGSSLVTLKNIIDYLNVLWNTSGTLFRLDSENKYHYLANNTSFLSNEEWEYLNTNLDSNIRLSEFLILYDRINKLESDMVALKGFDNWDDILLYTNNYLGFVYPLIETNRDCFDYFLDFNSENFKIINTQFARAIHECQHEEFLTLSKVSFRRFKGNTSWGTWGIHTYRDPDVYHYYDYINSVWVDSNYNSNLPATHLMYPHYPELIQKNGLIKAYANSEDASADTLGIQGLLSEFCSFSLETKVQAVSYSLGMNKADFHSLDYESYRKMELLLKDYLLYLKQTDIDLYYDFISDTDTIRMINNIFKDMDLIESLYPWHMKTYSEVEFLDWEKELNVLCDSLKTLSYEEYCENKMKEEELGVDADVSDGEIENTETEIENEDINN